MTAARYGSLFLSQVGQGQGWSGHIDGLETMMDNVVRKDSARVHPPKTCVHIFTMERLSATG